jgi:HK97 family phage portal protein
VKKKPTRKRRESRATLKNLPSNHQLYQALCGYGGSTASGVSVSETTALNLSAVWACVRVISETGGSLPWFTYKRTADGGRERFPDHEIYHLLHDAPNPDMSAMTWKETTLAHVLLWGNGFSEIVRDGRDRIAALFPITPDRVTVRQRTDHRLFYEVTNGENPPTILEAEDMYHVPGLGFDGLVGYSVVHKARESLGLGLAGEKFGASFFGNGAHAGGFLKHPGQLSPVAKKNLRESIEALHKGSENAHKFGILEEGMEWMGNTVPPNDAQFLETRSFQVEEVCRWFRVPPHKIQHLARSTFSNIEHQSIEFVTDTIRPWLVRLEQEAHRKLLGPRERSRVYTENLVDALLRGDALSRSNALAVQYQHGVLLGDEWRAIENRNPLPDGLGQRPMVTVQSVPLDKLDAVLDAKTKPAPPPANNSARSMLDRHLDGIRETRGDAAADAEARRLAALISANLEGAE